MFFPFDKINAQYAFDNEFSAKDVADGMVDAQVDLSDLSPKVIAILGYEGITITDEGVEVKTFEAFDRANDLFVRVMDAYDSEDNSLWDQLELSGDDDVDYNGGIPQGVFESIKNLWEKMQ